jgi:hypothetical protein
MMSTVKITIEDVVQTYLNTVTKTTFVVVNVQDENGNSIPRNNQKFQRILETLIAMKTPETSEAISTQCSTPTIGEFKLEAGIEILNKAFKTSEGTKVICIGYRYADVFKGDYSLRFEFTTMSLHNPQSFQTTSRGHLFADKLGECPQQLIVGPWTDEDEAEAKRRFVEAEYEQMLHGLVTEWKYRHSYRQMQISFNRNNSTLDRWKAIRILADKQIAIAEATCDRK